MKKSHEHLTMKAKNFGEVLTPISLVNDMVNALPFQVWSNPYLKWLDPCTGTGVFIEVIAERLMEGLKRFIPDEKLRYKHIMENMIYACELQVENVLAYSKCFDPNDEYHIHVFTGDYLSHHFDDHMKFWGIEKFDVIVMNPPFQIQVEGKRSHPLWDKFLIKTLDQLVEGGYLCAIHPSGWRNHGGLFKNIQTLLKSKLLYLEMHSHGDAKKVFGAEIRYDFYCLYNTSNVVSTKIKCQDGSIEYADLSQMNFIPNGRFNDINNLIAVDGQEKISMLKDNIYHTQKPYVVKYNSDEYCYPCVNFSPKSEIPVCYCTNDNTLGHFGIPKLILSNGRIKSIGCILDAKGEYGMTEFAFAIVDDISVLPKIKQAIDSKEFRVLMEECSINDSYFNKRVMATFRKDFWKQFV